MRTALVIGASGRVGRSCIEELTINKNYKLVHALVRKPIRKIKNIYLQKHIVDFDNLEEYKELFEGVDDVFCLLHSRFTSFDNTENKAKLNYDYPLALARIAKEKGVKQFILLNPPRKRKSNSGLEAGLRAKLEDEIDALEFESYKIFRVRSVSYDYGTNKTVKLFQEYLLHLANVITGGYIQKIMPVDVKRLSRSMVTSAAKANLGKREFEPKHIYKIVGS